jgi:hypothetical protein
VKCSEEKEREVGESGREGEEGRRREGGKDPSGWEAKWQRE